MGRQSIDVDAIERWFLFAPMVLVILGWLQLNLILLGHKTSVLSVLILLPFSLIIVKKSAPKAVSNNNSSLWVLLTLGIVIVICEFIRPAASYAVQYDGGYHILQASTYADLLDFDVFNRIFRPPLLPVLLSTTLVFDDGGSLSLLMLRCIVLLFGLQTYILGKKLGASTIAATILAVAAVTSPTVIDWGARYYHGIFAAMLATMVMNLLLHIDWKKCSPVLMMFIGFSSGGVSLARYSFSYLLGVIGFSGLMTKRIQPMIWFILAWSVAVLPFMLNDWMETGDLLTSLRPQIDAPVDRALDPIEGVGWSADNFPILGYLDLRLDLLSDGAWFLGLGGIGLLLRDKKWNELAVLSAIAIPHILIYSLLLGYGEERYMLLLVPLWCALAALSFDSVLQWASQLINPQPKSLDESSKRNFRKRNFLHVSQERFDSAVRSTLSCIIIWLIVFAPLVNHLEETDEYHWKTYEWVNMMRSIAEEVPDDATMVASSKDLQIAWLTRGPSKEPPSSFESLRSWMSDNDASHILTRNRGTPEPCAKDVTLCIEAPWLIPIAALSESSGWMTLWEYDGVAGEYQSSNLSIEPFINIESLWHGHKDGAIDLIRNDLLVVRHYSDEVTLNPALFNATSIEIDIVVFRFDAWPVAAIDLEYGRINDISTDDRFYAASWNSSSFAHSGPFAENNSLPTSLNASFTFSPSDYGRGGASGIHYIRLRAINY
jgi:hypothetical protein